MQRNRFVAQNRRREAFDGDGEKRIVFIDSITPNDSARLYTRDEIEQKKKPPVVSLPIYACLHAHGKGGGKSPSSSVSSY